MPEHVCENGFAEGSVVKWAARCRCGFEGDPGSYDDAVHAYEQHVREHLGDAAHYEAPVVCVNCAYRGPARIPVGMDVWRASCPMCATTQRLRPEGLYDEQQARRENPTPRWPL